jgi:hypothetical protein
VTAARGRSARFLLAPVVDGAAVWSSGVDVVLAPIRLASPVPVVLAPPRGGAR